MSRRRRLLGAATLCVAVATACAEAPEAVPSTDTSGQAPGEEAPTTSPRMAPNLVVNLLGCDRDGDSLRTTASIRNQGQEDVRYVDVSLTWADSTGGLVATDVASIVGGETLMAGDSVVFGVATAHPQATQCAETSIFFYEPIP
jgi:hypothetical protein